LGAGVVQPAPADAQSAPAQTWPSRVVASYKVTFNGFDIGHFNFNSDVSRSGYTLSSDAELSALLGTFKWQGALRSSGSLVSEEPKPAGYTFDYRANSKSGSVKMGFTEARVSKVSILPPSDTHPDTVPVKEHHLHDVLDPLSAVMAVTRASANPCARRLAVFDGKQRFDLILSFRRQQKVVEKHATGLPAFAYVCKVRYIPVAGYRMNEQTKQLSSESGIEVALRPVPHANLVVPYLVTIPTFAGTASMTLHRVEITTSDKGQIALVQ
jgi:hypothetical protein